MPTTSRSSPRQVITRIRKPQVYVPALAVAIAGGVSLTVAALIPSSGQPHPVTSGCAWPGALNPLILAGSSEDNVSNPDTASDYWIMPVPVEDGLRVTLSGRYPDSRYMSIAVYDADGSPFTANGVGSTLTDYRIAPDPGSVNPWQHQAAPGGRFTVTLRFGVAPGQVNTLPLAPAGTPAGATDVIFYRVYVAHGGPGRVPLPAITITRDGESSRLPQCPANSQDQIPKSYCSIPWVGREAPVCGAARRAVTAGATGTIAPFAREPAGAGGTPDNDQAYLSATVVPPPDADVLVIRAKAPTTPGGNAPAPWPEPGIELRYWSLCVDLAKPPVPVVLNRLPDGTVDYGCRYDNQAEPDPSGYYTFVIGREWQRAAIARIPGAVFLPYSATQPVQRYKLNLRNMLPQRRFTQAIQDVPANGLSASAAAAMGPYYPRMAFCPLATLAASGPAACMRAAAPPSANLAATATGLSGHPIPTALFACAITGWAALEARQALRRRHNATPVERGGLLIVVLCGIIAVTIARLAVAKVPQAAVPGGLISLGVGLSIMCGGILLRVWSITTLGRYFTYTVKTSPDQPVITSGPYRFVRHPSYLGFILAFIGIGFIQENWVSIMALTLIPLIGFARRIHVEENALTSTLGNAYSSYASTHKRLIPFVW